MDSHRISLEAAGRTGTTAHAQDNGDLVIVVLNERACAGQHSLCGCIADYSGISPATTVA
jgi:hypothetical protein